MIWSWGFQKILEQIRSLAFIVLYLVFFQTFVLGTAPSDALRLAFGLGLVVLGLALFLEGLFLGLMPIGERVGILLPQKGGLWATLIFGTLLGVGSTLAEPAIASLRIAGAGVPPWSAPLLYRMLENEPGLLVNYIGAGVGVAVALGMLRFYFGISIKPFIFTLIPLLLIATVYCGLDSNLSTILGLSWDTGAVTTGTVTVPLVLALGIGVSRALGKQDSSTGGFGAIMLASACPVLSVMILGMTLNATTPAPVSETCFFSPEYRSQALALTGTEENLQRIAFRRAGMEGRLAFFNGEDGLRKALLLLATKTNRRDMIGDMSLNEWFISKASPEEKDMIPVELLGHEPVHVSLISQMPELFRSETALAIQAVIPLTILLLFVLMALLRDRPRYFDEVTLGIIFALIGMIFLTSGIKLGLAPLGNEVGRSLPRVFRSMAREEGRMFIGPFDEEQVFTTYTTDGTPRRFFYLDDHRGIPRPVPFDNRHYDPENMRYEHIVERLPLFGPELTMAGIALVLLFAFGLGYGSTLAEPALNALGRTIEELTVGTIRRKAVIHAVSAGVGTGLVLGVLWILYDLSPLWMLLPPYLLLLPLTYWSEEGFSSIAWDCGGVTTGSMTVPLVLAMGLSIGGELNVADGFGVLAMASAYPVISVLLYGLYVRSRQREIIIDEGEKA